MHVYTNTIHYENTLPTVQFSANFCRYLLGFAKQTLPCTRKSKDFD